jgi:hypothetical protein
MRAELEQRHDVPPGTELMRKPDRNGMPEFTKSQPSASGGA